MAGDRAARHPDLAWDRPMKLVEDIGLGGGCHWCTEGIFQMLKGVVRVDQGFIRSEPPSDAWAEGVIVHFDPAEIDRPIETRIIPFGSSNRRTSASGTITRPTRTDRFADAISIPSSISFGGILPARSPSTDNRGKLRQATETDIEAARPRRVRVGARSPNCCREPASPVSVDCIRWLAT